MRLYFLRHGIAVERGASGYEVDSERPLTAQGQRKVFRIAEGMHTLGLTFDVILSSPWLRASKTAEIVAAVLGLEEKLEMCDALSGDAGPDRPIREITSRFNTRKSILLVGHEPGLSRLISVLVAGHADLPLVMKKGGLGRVTAERLKFGQCATLDWLLAPKHLIRLA